MRTVKWPRTFWQRAHQYLDHRRALGYRMQRDGQMLLLFARWADDLGHRGPVTVALALQWATLPAQAAKTYHAHRLTVVRCFARYCALFDPDTEIPSTRLLGPAYRRCTPFIYSSSQQQILLAAARRLAPSHGLRPHTYVALFGLLWCTGLRISEALNLRRENVDWQSGLLTVEQTKFRKSRLVPLHRSAVQALRTYAQRRDHLQPLPRTNHFLLSEEGDVVKYGAVRSTFLKLRKLVPVPAGRRRPRLHDFRHTFACQRLLAWYRDGIDVNHAITALATYLGHAQVTDTYWYLTATPELLGLAGDRFQHGGASNPCDRP